jgi:copper chaperone CopZ
MYTKQHRGWNGDLIPVQPVEYLHAVDGRIRIKSPTVKGAPQKAAEVEQLLRECDGISHVTTNPVTGSVLVLYDSQRLSSEDMLALLQKVGFLTESRRARTPTEEPVPALSEFGRGLLRTVAMSTMEFAVQRLVYAVL